MTVIVMLKKPSDRLSSKIYRHVINGESHWVATQSDESLKVNWRNPSYTVRIARICSWVPSQNALVGGANAAKSISVSSTLPTLQLERTGCLTRPLLTK